MSQNARHLSISTTLIDATEQCAKRWDDGKFLPLCNMWNLNSPDPSTRISYPVFHGGFTPGPLYRFSLHELTIDPQFAMPSSVCGVYCAIWCDVVRRMFPALKLKVSGLDPNVNYVIMVDIVAVDCYRYKFQDNRWVVAGKADQPVIGRQVHVHPDSPATGQHWMNRTLSFHKLKLTNNVVDKHGHVSGPSLTVSHIIIYLY